MTPEFTRNLPIDPKSRSLRPVRLLAAVAGALLVFSVMPPALAQTPTMLVLRAMPAKAQKGEPFKPLPALAQSDIGEIKIGGKTVAITSVTPLLKGPTTLQLMVLLDSEQMIGGNGQFDSMNKFFTDMPSNIEIGVGWMLQSKAVIVQPPTLDRALVAKVLIRKTREEAASPKNDNGNPYSCLKDLAAHWPNGDPAKLRAVLMFTDGITRTNGNGQSKGDQQNDDVTAASQFLQRASIVPFPFFWLDYPPVDPNRSNGGQLEGQQNFTQLAKDTGGEALQEGQFAPGTFDPLLNKLYSVFQGSVVVTVTAPGPAGKFQRLDVKSTKDDIKILGPDSVMVGNVLPKK